MAAGKIDDLSEAERDAIISKLMNQEAKTICDPLVKGWLCLAVFFSFCHSTPSLYFSLYLFVWVNFFAILTSPDMVSYWKNKQYKQ